MKPHQYEWRSPRNLLLLISGFLTFGMGFASFLTVPSTWGYSGGLAAMALGLLASGYRTIVRIDRKEGTVARMRGLLIPLVDVFFEVWADRCRINSLERIVISRICYEQARTWYDIRLEGENESILFWSCRKMEKAENAVKPLADFLQLPVVRREDVPRQG